MVDSYDAVNEKPRRVNGKATGVSEKLDKTILSSY